MNDPIPKQRILAFSPLLKSAGLLAAVEAEQGYILIQPETAQAVRRTIDRGDVDLILVDDDDRIPLSDLISQANSFDPPVPLLLYRSGSQPSDNVWAADIEDCLLLPISPAHLLHHISRAIGSRHLAEKVQTLAKENELLYQLSITDGLTKLVNKRYFLERLTSEFARIRRFGGQLGLVMGDIDHFKLVNDTFGHIAGDIVLKTVAGLVGSSVRKIDTACRYGGEEFVLMLPETALEGTMTVAEKVRSSVEAHRFSAEGDIKTPECVTISLGCATFPGSPSNSGEDLLSFADQALYRAKQSGRNRVASFPFED